MDPRSGSGLQSRIACIVYSMIYDARECPYVLARMHDSKGALSHRVGLSSSIAYHRVLYAGVCRVSSIEHRAWGYHIIPYTIALDCPGACVSARRVIYSIDPHACECPYAGVCVYARMSSIGRARRVFGRGCLRA